MGKNLLLKKWTIFDYINVCILFILGAITLYPFYNVLIVSLNDPTDALTGGLFFFIRKFTFANYIYFFNNNNFTQAFFISVSRTVLGAGASVLFTAAFAYGMSKKRLVGRGLFMTIMLITIYVSGGLIPYFLLIKGIGLYKNFLVYIIPNLFNAYNAIIMMTFFRGIPGEIEESVKIDGANDLTVFIRIILPISMPVVATIALFNAVWQWNSWFDAMIFGGRQLVPLQLLLVEIIRDVDMATKLVMDALGSIARLHINPSVESVKATAMAITAIPIIMVYPFLQKYFVKGIMIGSLKG